MYEINVSKREADGGYRHYFATASRSITNRLALEKVVADFVNRFPSPEFNISVSYTPQKGMIMSARSFMSNPENLTL